jgi:aminotransferase
MNGVIDLGIGEPDFNAPYFVRVAAKKSITEGFGKYTANAGLLELREVIARKLHSENEIIADPKSEILVTSAATQAIFVVMNCLLNPGDEVLLPAPFFVAYKNSAMLAGGTCVEIPSKEDQGFALDLEDMERHCSKRTKLLVLNSPCNPTGSILQKDAIEKACEFATRHNLYIISDEIYEKYLYDGVKHFSPASISEFRDRVITVNGFAKTFGMTGWRLGYATANSEIINAMIRFNMVNAVCATSFVQTAGIAALDHSLSFFKPILARFKRKLDLVCDSLDYLGWDYQKPRGAFYVFPRIPKKYMNSFFYSKKLLESNRVATIPGSAFGLAGENHIRISFSLKESNLRAGLDRIKKLEKE